MYLYVCLCVCLCLIFTLQLPYVNSEAIIQRCNIKTTVLKLIGNYQEIMHGGVPY